ncbi:hypothetical protein ACIQ9I_03105 [Streptomyces sp. NPDC094461]|uniref:hypothetical protein n=1 Tax=unclassified Streptomyces TaxID=2593676 RepID=UPI003808C5C3
MDGPIFGLCSVLSLLSMVVALSRAISQRRRKNDLFCVSRVAHAVALASSFVGSALAVPVVAEIVDRTTITELSSLVSDIAALVFCVSLQVMVIDWEYRDLPHDVGIACRVGFVIVVCGLLIWQFRRTNPAHLDVELSTSYVEFSDVRTYLLTYLSFFAAAGSEVAMRAARLARGAWRQGRAAGAGLAIAAAGASSGVLYAVSRGGYVLAFENGHAWPLALDNSLSPALAGLSIGGVVAGLSMAVLSNGRRSGAALRRKVNA